MKILLISIIVLLIAGLLACTTNSVYAPCLIGVISCGPPPGVTVSAGTDSQFYEKNDTIKVQGQVYVQNYSKSIHLLVVNPDNATIQSIDTPVINGKFGLKIRANFDKTGVYQIITCLQNWCDRSYFKFISEPYKLTANNQDYLIKYKSFADLVGMEADINNQVLRVHVTNAAAQGLQFVIDLPRALIDSKGYATKDASFRVFIGMHQPDKYMQPANFTEIASNNLSRTLAIDIPYEPVPNSSGVWDFKITSFLTSSSGSAVLTQSPLKQFKSGIAANDVKCKQGLQLVIKAEDGSPACVKPQTAQKLVEHGWGWAMQPIKSLQPKRIIGLENDMGIVTLGNQTYYFETPNYTDTVYSNPVQSSFHEVIFTLFPSGFKGGLPTSPGCGSGSVGEIVAGSGSYYWTDAKFSDGIHELLHIFADSQPCPEHPIPTYFSTHTNPQAGLTFYDGKMKLLVSTDNQISSALRLYLSTDSTYANPAEAVGVDISLNNTSSKTLILPKADNWPRNDLSSGPCSNLPFGIAILKGYYSEQNMTGASSLVIYQNIPCPLPPSIKSYTFQPLSSKATQECDSLFSCPELSDMKIHLKVDGFMDNNGQHRPFNVGTYTIVGGDEWGHVAIQHFTEAYATAYAGVK